VYEKVTKCRSYPVLYSFRRCPYAMRARMIIAYSGVSVEIREVVLKDKPDEMIAASPKGTVPVLIYCNEVGDQTLLEESLDIMQWALALNDPDNIDLSDVGVTIFENVLIKENDSEFKTHLDHYKYADRFPAHDVSYYRSQGEVFLSKLEGLLLNNHYLAGDKMSVVDIAIFPFIRQFAHVDKKWFDGSPYLNLKRWLEGFLESEMFEAVMPKLAQWQPGDEIILFPFE